MVLLKLFLKRFDAQRQRIAAAPDLSALQKREAIINTLQQWSDIYPRRGVIGEVQYISGSKFITFPNNFQHAEHNQLEGLISSSQTTPGEIVHPTLTTLGFTNFFLGSGISNDVFSNPVASTRFPPGYDVSIPQSTFSVNQTSRGKWAIELTSESTATTTVKFKYDAIHEIGDSGRLLTVVSLPNPGDTLRVQEKNTDELTDKIDKTYTFVTSITADNQILIASDIYEQAEFMTDQLLLDDVAIADEESNKVFIRPFDAGLRLVLTVDGTRLTDSALAGINTLPRNHQWQVFLLLMLHTALSQQRSLISGEKTCDNQIEVIDRLAEKIKEYREILKPYLSVPAGSC